MQYNRQPDRRPMSAANKLAIFVIVLVIFGAGAASIFLNNRDSGGALQGSQLTPTPGIVPGIADVQNRAAEAAATPEPTGTPAVLVTPEPTGTPVPNFQMTPTPTLKLNSSGEEVRALQERLIELGYLKEGANDAQFGKGTQNAVKAFQAANGLGADGAAGPKTLTLLFSNDAKRKPE